MVPVTSPICFGQQPCLWETGSNELGILFFTGMAPESAGVAISAWQYLYNTGIVKPTGLILGTSLTV